MLAFKKIFENRIDGNENAGNESHISTEKKKFSIPLEEPRPKSLSAEIREGTAFRGFIAPASLKHSDQVSMVCVVFLVFQVKNAIVVFSEMSGRLYPQGWGYWFSRA